jgi:hypothetical protein
MKIVIRVFGILALLSSLWISIGSAEPAEPMLEKVPSRPNAEAGPTQVSVFMWLVDVDSINSAQQNFVVNVFVGLQWKDPRLAHGRKAPKRYLTSDIWTPRIQILNEIGIVRRTMEEFADVEGDGTVTYRQRFVGPLSQPLNLREFPFDRHLFRIHLGAVEIGKDAVEFIPHPVRVASGLKQAVGIASDISLPDWKIERYDARPMPYVINEQLQIPGYVFEFEAARDTRYYVWKVFLPLILIVIMSWVAFWIDPKEIGTNISAVMTSMLTLVAYRFTFENYIPKVGYLTRIDKFMLWSTILVFFSMMQVAINCRLVARGRHALAVAIDRWARLVYPLIFSLIILGALKFL